MITKRSVAPRAPRRRPAGQAITSSVAPRQNPRKANPVFASLTPAQQSFTRQLQSNVRRLQAVTAATNTSNIAARPDFIELLPLFVQKLIITDVFGSIAMKSRQQIVPYMKFISESTKGETKAGDILNSPFVNRQGIDPNFGGRIVKNEIVAEGDLSYLKLSYTPVLPGSVTVTVENSGVATSYADDGTGSMKTVNGTVAGYINYSDGSIDLGTLTGDLVKATYHYDNETVGPDETGAYGAKMAKGYLQLDEFNLVAEAHEMACYWSIFSAFAAQQEWGANIGDIAKEAAFAELTAEINTQGFQLLERAAAARPAFNWDAGPVQQASVVPTDYLQMFKLKLGQAAASIYQETRLTRPNRLVVGSNVAEYMLMLNGFNAASIEDTVGPYKLGTLDQFEVYVSPDQDPNKWVMACKSSDIRRNSALFGEYMPMMNTDALGMANASIQQGYATMYGMKVVNPETVISGKILNAN